ncbi:hypothetical protein [Paenibacillus larvae]|uniref:F0F1 ATP synthase subunit alpha n=1 Tax=Paenibacillus larvae subsp. larvae TaxID=147375 RepID=A0A6C0QXU3_9BACL|nr:hypothetical protein [Paenibacillus larvae]QHZ53594.1 F0F1 ATP synthase subunit alpha [Paenibacillus larvae subsp. larvae]
MKKLILAGVLGVSLLAGTNVPGFEAEKASAATVDNEIKETWKHYSLRSYEVTPKESFYLKKGEELGVLLSTGYPITYTVYDADNRVIDTYNAANFGRIFKAEKDGNISVQFQAGVNSSFVKTMSFAAKFTLYK